MCNKIAIKLKQYIQRKRKYFTSIAVMDSIISIEFCKKFVPRARTMNTSVHLMESYIFSIICVSRQSKLDKNPEILHFSIFVTNIYIRVKYKLSNIFLLYLQFISQDDK